jgi:hypothetical protein
LTGRKITGYITWPVEERLERWRKEDKRFKKLEPFVADLLAQLAYDRFPIEGVSHEHVRNDTAPTVGGDAVPE